jgi:phage terminase small subunit
MGKRGPLPRIACPPIAGSGEEAGAPVPPPPGLVGDALDVWQRTEPLIRGRLRPEHATTLGAWCRTAAELDRLDRQIAVEGLTAEGPHGPVVSPAANLAAKLRGTLLALGKSLGLDPSSVIRNGFPETEEDELQRFVRARGTG